MQVFGGQVIDIAAKATGHFKRRSSYNRPAINIDLKDAYYTLPVSLEHRKYLRFCMKGEIYQYTCFLNGLSSAPRLFTKLTKPCYDHLRLRGHIVSSYIDDTYLQQQLFNNAVNSLDACKSFFNSLGLLIHPEKSTAIPSQIVVVLGFIINSLEMTVSLTTERKTTFLQLCDNTLKNNDIKIPDLSRIIGKTEAIKLNGGSLDSISGGGGLSILKHRQSPMSPMSP